MLPCAALACLQGWLPKLPAQRPAVSRVTHAGPQQPLPAHTPSGSAALSLPSPSIARICCAVSQQCLSAGPAPPDWVNEHMMMLAAVPVWLPWRCCSISPPQHDAHDACGMLLLACRARSSSLVISARLVSRLICTRKISRFLARKSVMFSFSGRRLEGPEASAAAVISLQPHCRIDFATSVTACATRRSQPALQASFPDSGRCWPARANAASTGLLSQSSHGGMGPPVQTASRSIAVALKGLHGPQVATVCPLPQPRNWLCQHLTLSMPHTGST